MWNTVTTIIIENESSVMQLLYKLCVVYDDAIASNVSRVHVYDNRFSSDGSGSENEEKMRIIDFFCFCSFFCFCHCNCLYSASEIDNRKEICLHSSLLD